MSCARRSLRREASVGESWLGLFLVFVGSFGVVEACFGSYFEGCVGLFVGAGGLVFGGILAEKIRGSV